MRTGGFKLAQEIFAVSTPQSHRYYYSKKDGLLGLPSPEHKQQEHGHRQMNFLLSKGGRGHEGGWGEADVWSRDELSLQKSVKCSTTGTQFVAVYLFLLCFTNAPVGFQTYKSCSRAENYSHCESTWLPWLAASCHPCQQQPHVPCDTQDTHKQQTASPQLIFIDKGRTIAKPEAHSMSFTMPCHQKQPPAAFIPEQRVLQNNLPGPWRAKAGSGWVFCFPPHWFIKHD